MNEFDRVLKILGFAQRARKLTLGMEATLQAIRKNKVRAVILAEDLSENARHKIAAAKPASVPQYVFGSKSAFAGALGRGETGIIGIMDDTFARSIFEIVHDGRPSAA